eukprot:TRINITY_DN35363_c0_g1_i1.p1 TRINITY_DN35363_c0_g1~~TRINITY_DN35363_c0_g1_i1.p1  ORF type:complete len:1499 (+),score=286.83 TRINITY_DN35363_c0_g1_i1:42-4538(+)
MAMSDGLQLVVDEGGDEQDLLGNDAKVAQVPDVLSRRIKLVRVGALIVSVLLFAVFAVSPKFNMKAAVNDRVGLESLLDKISDMISSMSVKSTKFPNIHLITSGYNVFYMDPMPKLHNPEDINLDPGLRKPVFEINYDNNMLTGDRRHKRPDGFFATIDFGCSTIFTTKSLRDQYSLAHETNMEASATSRAGVDYAMPPPLYGFSMHKDGVSVTGDSPISVTAFAGVEGTLSMSQQTMRSHDLLNKNRMERSSAKCSAYSAGLDWGAPPKTAPEFEKAFSKAKSNSDWFNIFDEYGTHFFTMVRMGARFGMSKIFSKSQYNAMWQKMNTVGLTVGPVVEAGIKLSVSNEEIDSELPSFEWKPKAAILDDVPWAMAESAEVMKAFSSMEVMQAVGPALTSSGTKDWIKSIAKDPVPIRMEKMVICVHPGLSSTQAAECSKAMKNYCVDHLEPKGASCDKAEKRECLDDMDCKLGYSCRQFTCMKIPKCVVTLYAETNYRGASFALEPVDGVETPDGKFIDLRNNNWNDRVDSIELGEDCKQAKLFDDDPGNVWGGHPQDKMIYSSWKELSHDLSEDVKAIHVWAKKLPGEKPVAPDAEANPPKVSFSPKKDPSYVTIASDNVALNIFNKEGDYTFFPNIGKAMYGYHHHYGAPFSAKYAGVDPGFRTRGVWKVTYDKLNKGKEAIWKRMPMSPNAQYFVLFARKSPHIAALQWIMDNVLAYAIKFYKEKKEWLLKWKKRFEDGDYPTVQEYRELKRSLEDVTQNVPEFDVSEPNGELCEAQQIVDDLIEQVLSIARQKMKSKMYDWWSKYYGRRLEGKEKEAAILDGELQLGEGASRRLLETSYTQGQKYCSNGRLFIWSEDDQKRVENEKTAANQLEDDYEKKLQDCVQSSGSKGRFGAYLAKKACAAKLKAESLSPFGRRMQAVVQNQSQESRRLSSTLSDKKWFSMDQTPNIRMFGSLAKAKQALRSEVQCIGNTEARDKPGYKCPSGADYNINITNWELVTKGSAARMTEYDHMKNSLNIDWPRFVVKVVDNKIDSVETIDGQRQYRGYKEGFDSVLGDRWGRQEMLQGLQKHIDANPQSSMPWDSVSSIETLVPDGFEVVKSAGGPWCEKDMKTDMASDASSYEKLVESSLGGSWAGEFLSFGLSYETKDYIKTSGKEKKKMYTVQAECASYWAKLDEKNPPEVEPSFKTLVDTATEDDHFWQIFDFYGLHYLNEVVFGARYGSSQYITESSFQTYSKQEKSLSLDFGIAVSVPIKEVPGASVTSGRDFSVGWGGSKTDASRVENYFEQRKTFSIGKAMPKGGIEEWMKDLDGEPMPIKQGMVPMCNHPVFSNKRDECRQAMDSYCHKYLKISEPEAKCSPSKKTQCLWDFDCEEPNTRCTREGVCEKKPGCTLELFSRTSYRGSKKVVGPIYYKPSAPLVIEDLEKYGWAGKARSIKASGGCNQITLMKRNALHHSSNDQRNNYRSNDEILWSSVSGINYVQVYPKEFVYVKP